MFATSVRKIFPSRTPARGFSLAEVAIALGIVVFVIVALIGIIGYLLGDSRRSSDDTALAGVISGLNSQVRSLTNSAALTAVSPLFYSKSGEYLGTNSAQTNSKSFYRIELSDVSPSNVFHRKILRAKIAWPPPKFPHSHQVTLGWYGKS